MTAILEPQTSMTSRTAVSPWSALDTQTRSWVLSGDQKNIPTRLDVLRYTQREIASLRRLPVGWDADGGIPLRAELATIAISMIAAMTNADGMATPQFSPYEDGGLHVTWLVGGDRMTMTLDSDEIDLRGVSSDGHEAFRFARRFGSFSSSELEVALNDARSFLAKISTRVRHQLLTR